MYYHCRDIKLVQYDKILPAPISAIAKDDNFFLNIYNWLGHYCGYSPQVWLSRSRSQITGIRSIRKYTKQNGVYIKNNQTLCKTETKFVKSDDILLGFENIQGFNVSYEPWCFIMSFVGNHSNFNEQNKCLVNEMNELCKMMHDEDGTEFEYKDDILLNWEKYNNLDIFLNKILFVEHDQVIVPSLNLKSAKKIICKDEKQRKTLRKMGFIEDRIEIKNLKRIN